MPCEKKPYSLSAVLTRDAERILTSRRSSTDSGRGAAADRRISRCAAVLLSARGDGRQGVAGGCVEPSSRFLARTFRSGLSAGIRLRTAARVQAGAGSVVENAPKTLSSCRTLPLDEGLVAVLKRSVRYAQDRLALGAAHADSSYVAVNEGGRTRPTRSRGCGTNWPSQPVCDRSGCTTPGTPAGPRCTCEACCWPSSRSATPTRRPRRASTQTLGNCI